MVPEENMQECDNSQKVCIIGMSVRFPGAATVEQLWQNLREGVESISFFSEDEVIAAGVPREIAASPNHVKANGVLEGIELFDAGFFNVSPREAQMIDPQQRIFLECAWESMEDAGYDPGRYAGEIAVFGGVGRNSYLLNLLRNMSLLELVGGYQSGLGNEKDFVATRVAYKLNLRGPAMTVQTACSTSLVAVHLACQSLLNHESDMALAGGATITVPQKAGYIFEPDGIFSQDGHCRSFDASATGCVPSDGAAVVLLKRFEDALADGDQIYAVILGSAVNNDGATKIGYTAPSVLGQARVIARAQAMAGVNAKDVSYIEAHGTATRLGDVIELEAFSQAFRATTKETQFCAIGSIKTNLGHTDCAAGVAGLIKTGLCLKHKVLVPSLHFKEPNPKIDFNATPFYVNNELRPWLRGHGPLRAGVNSLGIGGTNVHVVMEEPPEYVRIPTRPPAQVLVLSAPTKLVLHSMIERLERALDRNSQMELGSVAYTLQTGRKELPERCFVVCETLSEGARLLAQNNAREVEKGTSGELPPSIAFLFPGGGAQHSGMALGIHGEVSIFREEIERCCSLLAASAGIDLRGVLFSDSGASPAAPLKDGVTALPALFAVEYALAKMWMAWGVRPEAMIGHSLGEYVAACLADVFSLKDALCLVALRGRLLSSLPPGAMLSVSLPENEIQSRLDADVQIAAVNSASSCVVSGPQDALQRAQLKFLQEGIEAKFVAIALASHSAMVDSILPEFHSFLKKVKLACPQIPYISNVTGCWIGPEEPTDPHYWCEHLRKCVRFAPGIDLLLQDSARVLLEVGPGRTLTSLIAQKAHGRSFSTLRHPMNPEPDFKHVCRTLGHLWVCGAKIDWNAVQPRESKRRVSLPTYPFQRQRHWVEPDTDHSEKYQAAKSESNAGLVKREYPGEEPGKRFSVYDKGSIEDRVLQIFTKLLGVEDLSQEDNFFRLGGDSLIAMRLVAHCRDEFHVNLPIRSIFESPTVSQLSLKLKELLSLGSRKSAPPIVKTSRDARLPLSFAQQRLWFIQQLDPASPMYNESQAVRLRGPLNPQALQSALLQIIQRHEVLRTSFAYNDDQPFQMIHAKGTLDWHTTSVREVAETDRISTWERHAAEEAQRPFDLTCGPLLRASLTQLDIDDHILTLTMHHITTDAWSFTILSSELSKLYDMARTGTSAALPELTVQYADFAVWERSWMQGENLETGLSYWRRQLADLPALYLAPDRQYTSQESFAGRTEPVFLPLALSDSVEMLCGTENVTLFMFLLTAFDVLLGWKTGQTDITVGTNVTNRNSIETEKIIGFFINQIALRVDIAGGPTFRELLARVRQVTMDAYAHQDVPFDKVVEVADPIRDLQRHPLFQVKFALQNAPLEAPRFADLEVVPMGVYNNVARLPLMLVLARTDDGLAGEFEYRTSLFEVSEIKSLIMHYQSILDTVVSNPDISIAKLNSHLSLADAEFWLRDRARLESSRLSSFQRRQRTPIAAPANSDNIPEAAAALKGRDNAENADRK